MSPGETVSRSPLDKPLHQLTEDDISQVTREDCRRYLKEKGMRRPSWNKSQAMQQVISLKTLLETPPDSDFVEVRKKLYIPPCPENPPRVVSESTAPLNETTQYKGIPAPVNEPVRFPRPDPLNSDFSGDNSGRTIVSGNGSVSPRSADAVTEQAGQMTIFYCGKVNVYDDIPGLKAQAVLQLAARPLFFSQETPADQSTSPCFLQAAGVKLSPGSPMVMLPSLQTVKVTENCQFPREESNISQEDNLGDESNRNRGWVSNMYTSDTEGPTSRKASVLRYLEKKKDRFKNKRKLATPSSPTFDVFLSTVGEQLSNEQMMASEPYSSFQARPQHSPLRCSSIENFPKIATSLATHPDTKDVFNTSLNSAI